MSQPLRRADSRHEKSGSHNDAPRPRPAPQNPANRATDPTPPAAGQIVERLEDLDDTIFEAIGGCDKALERARYLWPRLIAELGWEAVEESREQYLRYAMSVWQESRERDVAGPEQSIAALEIIALLTGDAEA